MLLLCSVWRRMDEAQSLQGTFGFDANSARPVEPLRKIRIETVLSKFPIHTLSKTGKVDICITDAGEQDKESFFGRLRLCRLTASHELSRTSGHPRNQSNPRRDRSAPFPN